MDENDNRWPSTAEARHLGAGTVRGVSGGRGSVSQQFQASQPADQQGRFRRRGRLGPRGHGFLLGPFLLEWDGGAAVEV